VELRLGIRALVVAALAVVTAAAGVLAFSTIRAQAADDAEADFLRQVLPVQAELDTELSETVSGLARLGVIDGSELRRTADALAAELELEALVVFDAATTTPATARDELAGHGIVLDPSTEGDPGANAATEIARDTAGLRATPPLATVGGRPVTLLVLPRFGPEGPPSATAARRTAVREYVVAALRPERLARRILPQAVNEGGRIELRDGTVPLFATGEAGGGPSMRTTFSAAGRSWTLVATAPPTGAPATAGLALVGGLLMSIVIVGGAVVIHRDEQRAAHALQARDEDLGVIAGFGPLLQESLELADVLPAAAAFFVDRFDLSGLSITQVDGDVLVEAYTTGRRLVDIPRLVSQLRPLGTQLAAGESGSVALLRGGRLIGALHVAPRADLGPQRLSTLVALAEMLGTALANAVQFEREQETVRRLREIDRLQQEFLGTVSHELQTPITAILGFSSILDAHFEELTPEERRDYLSRVARNATSLSGLVHQLLDLSRIGRSSFELRLRRVDLAEAVSDVVAQFATLAEKHRLEVQAVPGMWAEIDTDAFERILSNLLSNAAKFSPPGSQITVGVKHERDGAVICVDDEGPGVAEEDRPHVFRRFFRGGSEAAVSTRGAGIGLAVVQDLVERMNGRVWVEAAPRGGARFCVFFPTDREGSPDAPPSATAGQGRAT
jgi:signal transduction histidine kinase